MKKENLSDLILRIHAATLDPKAWTAVVEELRVALNGRGAMLHTPQVSVIDDYWCFHSNFDPAEIERYARDWMPYDVWAEGARTRGFYSPEGIVCPDDRLVEHRVVRRSAFFHEYLRENDIDRMITVNLYRSRTERYVAHTQLSIFRGIGKDAFSRDDAELLEHVKPHLLIATRNYCSLRSLRALSATTEFALDHLSVALYAIAREGHVVYLNRAGEEAINNDGWFAYANRRLSAGKDVLNAEACASAIHDLLLGKGRTLVLRRASTRRERVLITTPISEGTSQYILVLPNAIGLLWLLPERPEVTAVKRLAQLFELTPAEARLLAKLAEDLDVKTASEELGISVHTARNELKSILRKKRARNADRATLRCSTSSPC
ncbi:MAG TPA: hypothetical protein VF339_08060 [Gammaproteobacteria bacterium]